MPLSWDEAIIILQGRIADSSDPVAVAQALNQAQLEVARARRWPELMKRTFFNTEAAYSTGTVAVTADSTTVTLTGGTFPATVASGTYRFALNTSDPWYGVATRSSGTVVLLAQAYIDDTDASTDYIVYKSHYSLATDVDRVEEIWLHRDGRAIPMISTATDQMVTDFLHYPSGPGVPTHFYPIERTSSGGKQVLLGPETPDDVYRVEYTYRKKVTPDTLSGNLDETRWPAILARAGAILYEPEFYERHIAAQAEYQRLLKEEWGNESDTETQEVRVGEARMRATMGRYDNLMGFGRLEDA